jgi:hypothetical protein
LFKNAAPNFSRGASGFLLHYSAAVSSTVAAVSPAVSSSLSSQALSAITTKIGKINFIIFSSCESLKMRQTFNRSASGFLHYSVAVVVVVVPVVVVVSGEATVSTGVVVVVAETFTASVPPFVFVETAPGSTEQVPYAVATTNTPPTTLSWTFHLAHNDFNNSITSPFRIE